MSGKRFTAVLAVLLVALPLGGCMRPIQLNERAIVQAIGVDYEDGYRLTLTLYAPQDQKGGDDAQKKSPAAEGFGATVGEALEDAKLKTGKEIFWGQSKLIVIGGETARHGLPGVLGFFNDSFESRPNIDIVTTPGKAGDLLKAETEEAPAVLVRNLLENNKRNGRVPRARLMDLVGALESGGLGAFTPLAELSGEPDGAQSIGITGLALYRNGRYSGRTDLTAARGVLWLRGDIDTASIAVPDVEGRQLSMSVVRAKTKLKPSIVNGVPHFVVECSFQAHLSGEDAPGGSLAGAAQAAENGGAEIVQREIEAALEQTIVQSGSDVLGLALLLRQKEPEWYGQNAAAYEVLLPRFTFTMDVETRVTRYGLQG